MKEEKVRSILTSYCSSSIAHLYGNTTALIRDFFIRIFPKNYIKSVYINTRDLSEEIEDVDNIRKDKPILVIRPEISLEMDATLSGRLSDWHYKNYFVFQNPAVHYVPIFRDVEKEIFVYSIPQRQKMSFSIDVVLSTKMAAINSAIYLRESVLHKGYFYIDDVYLETEIPKRIIENLIEVNNFDVSTPDGMNELLEYLNMNSKNQIVRKKNLASGIYQYYYGFKTNILAIFPDTPEVDDGEQSGQIDKDFKMSTKIEIEFSCPFNYVFESGTNFTIKELDDEELIHLLNETFSLNTSIPKPPPIQKEDEKQMKLVLWEGFITESNIVDILDISSVVGTEIRTVVEYCKTNNMDINEIFKVELWMNKHKICEDEYKFNWDLYELTTIRPEKDMTYHIGIYADISRCNVIFENLDRRDLCIESVLKKVE